jgi:hypothetical protein
MTKNVTHKEFRLLLTLTACALRVHVEIMMHKLPAPFSIA